MKIDDDGTISFGPIQKGETIFVHVEGYYPTWENATSHIRVKVSDEIIALICQQKIWNLLKTMVSQEFLDENRSHE